MIRRALLAVSLVVLSWTTRAADENHQFAIKGMGLATCERFVAARNAQSREYFQFGGCIDGYLSATNRYEQRTFDVVPWQSTGLLAAWLTRFCQRSPDVPSVRAGAMMVNTLGKGRLTTRSERVEARVGDATVYICESILLRVQERLSERGHYEGADTGNFDKRTREALERFQREAGLKPTGPPDQPTLGKLLD